MSAAKHLSWEVTPWTSAITTALGIPPIPTLDTSGVVSDRATATANFRDEYYALVPAVADHYDGPPLVTSGLIDPGLCLWGTHPVRFAHQLFAAPRVDVALLTGRFNEWAHKMLRPKVLVAAQTRTIEAVADEKGEWLPGVPVTTVIPSEVDDLLPLTAVINSPIARSSPGTNGPVLGSHQPRCAFLPRRFLSCLGRNIGST